MNKSEWIAIMVTLSFAAYLAVLFLQPRDVTCQSTTIIEYENNLETDNFSVAFTMNENIYTNKISADDFYAYKAGAPAQACEIVGTIISFGPGQSAIVIERVEQ